MNTTKHYYRKQAKQRECQVRIPGVCNFDTSTTVLAHINGSGLAMKSNDIHASWCCSDCHSCIDGAVGSIFTKAERDHMLLEGVIRTQIELISEGKL